MTLRRFRVHPKSMLPPMPEPYYERVLIVGEAPVINTAAMVVVAAVVGALASAVTYLFTMLTANRSAELANQKAIYEKQLEVERSNTSSWREMTLELGINIEKAVNRKRAANGLPPFKELAPIVPEHSSPVTKKQQQTAEIATMRARLVAATKELGIEPREAPPPATAAEEARLAYTKSTPLTDAAELNAKAEKKAVDAAEAMSDAKGAIDVAATAVDAASSAISTEKDK